MCHVYTKNLTHLTDILNKSIVTSFVKCCVKKFFSKAFEKRGNRK